jgi:hypothetical protein
MSCDDVITKVTQNFERKDGSEARIVAHAVCDLGGLGPVHVYVHRRESPEHSWKLCSDQPHPDWRTMSVDEYNKRGRSEKFQTVSHGEIFKVTNLIGKPMSCLN